MKESLNNLSKIREYLLGQISDEKTLEGIEELLFTDDDFCTKAEIVEDELINDFVYGKLVGIDLSDFEKTLENNSERQLKTQVTQQLKVKTQTQSTEQKSSFFESIITFFRQPIYAGSFAMLLIACLIGGLFLLRQNRSDELASLYQKERPNEARISDFDYAPLNITRGNNTENANKNKLEEIKLERLKAVNSNPNAENYHALGIFYLTQQNYKEAIENLEKAVKLEDKNAKYHNDLGTAYFEFGKLEKDNKLLNIAKANEEFSKAIELNPNFLEALFNKSLALQELNLPNRAKESWELYLQKDSSSKWADEARKNLEKIELLKSNLGKKKDDIFNDFVNAYKNKDEKTILKIHNSTKGFFVGLSLAEQLSEKIMEARKNKDDPQANQLIEMFQYIGNLEKEKYADFFFADWADFYAKLDKTNLDKTLKAKGLMLSGIQFVREAKYTESIKKFQESEQLFAQIGNKSESDIAVIWYLQLYRDIGKVDSAITELSLFNNRLIEKKSKVISPSVFDWLANGEYRKGNIPKAIKLKKECLKISEETENQYQKRQCNEGIAGGYITLGEFQKSLNYLKPAIENNENYFLNKSQYWRNLSTLTELFRKTENYSTSIDIAKESLWLAQEMPADAKANAYRDLAYSLLEKKDFTDALKIGEEAINFVENFPDSDEKKLIKADTLLFIAKTKYQNKNFENALIDFDKSLELYSQTPETLYNLYQIHKGKLLCYQQLQQQSNFENELNTVLKLSEETRKTIRDDDLRQSFFANEQDIYDAAIANALQQKQSKQAFEFAETSRGRSLLDFVKSEKTISELENEFSDISKPLTLSEIQNQMPENVQILQYAVLPNKLAIWQITKNGFELTEQPIISSEFEQKASDYRTAIINKTEAETIKKTAQEFYALLIPQNLENGKIICLIADKSLYQIPFASLISPNGKYLIEDFALIYNPSSSVFIANTENAKSKPITEKLLSIGNPNFDKVENPNLRNLPEAEIEAKEISKNYANNQKFIGTNASKQNFLDNFANAEIIHFAGHFVANNDSPSNSKMLFADAEFRSAELAEKKLRKTKLVVLSACETGFEKFNKVEGSIGIARTFLAIGTPLVVASNWKVDSDATKNLMISFHHKRTQERLNSIESLRQAQLEMLKTNDLSQPYYWSAFAVNGGATNY